MEPQSSPDRRHRTVLKHAIFQEIYRQVEECHRDGITNAEPDYLRICGVAGVGKTTLLETYLVEHPATRVPTGKVIPVLMASVPAGPTIKGMYSAVLHAMGDPDPFRGTAEHLRSRVLQLLHACHVELLILDEMQHFVDRGSARTHAKVADALKELLEKAKIPVIFCGAPRMGQLFISNAQLRTRAPREILVRPFTVDSESDVQQLLSFLAGLAPETPSSMAALLTDPSFAVRTFYASDGLVRAILKIVRRISKLVESGEPATAQTAAIAFAQAVWHPHEEHRNPYSPDFDERRLDGPGEPYEPTDLDGPNH